jgi:hypothetical protein
MLAKQHLEHMAVTDPFAFSGVLAMAAGTRFSVAMFCFFFFWPHS